MKIKKIIEKTGKAADLMSEYGLSYVNRRAEFLARLKKNPQMPISYREYSELTELTDKAILKQKARYEDRGDTAPAFVVFIDTEYSDKNMKERTMASLKNQTYMPEKVFIGKRDSIASRLTEYFKEKATDRYYIVHIPAGDELEIDYFYRLFVYITDNPDISIWYTDNEIWNKEDETKDTCSHAFKPDYTLDFLSAWNYIGEVLTIKADSLLSGYGELKDSCYEFLLKSVLEGRTIGHVPFMLYKSKQYDACGNKNQNDDTEIKLIRKIYENQYKDDLSHVSIINGPDETRRVICNWKTKPVVSVIIPTKDHIEDLAVALASLSTQTIVKQLEILIVENNSTEAVTEKYYTWLETGEPDSSLPSAVVDDEVREKLKDKIKILHWPSGFNYSAINNFAEAQATGDYILLLNNDIELINYNALEMLLMTAQRSDVGIVGAKLYYEDETVQHGGVVVGLGGVAGHAFLNLPKGNSGYLKAADCTRRVSAVTAACLMIRKSVYDMVGGLEEKYAVNFNDVDLCMKVLQTGLQIIYQPLCEAWHYESKTRGAIQTKEQVEAFRGEINLFLSRWDDFLKKGDRYYNRSLTLALNDYSIGNPFQIEK